MLDSVPLRVTARRGDIIMAMECLNVAHYQCVFVCWMCDLSRFIVFLYVYDASGTISL